MEALKPISEMENELAVLFGFTCIPDPTSDAGRCRFRKGKWLVWRGKKCKKWSVGLFGFLHRRKQLLCRRYFNTLHKALGAVPFQRGDVTNPQLSE